MKRKGLVITMALATLLSMSSCLNDMGADEQVRPEEGNDSVVNEAFEYVEGELFVKFSPEVESMLGQIGRSGATRSGVPSVDEVLNIVDGYHIERVFPVDSRNEERTRKSGLHLWYIVKFKGEKASEVAQKFSRLGEVQNVGLNYTISRNYSGKSTPISADMLTRAEAKEAGKWNDPLLDYQWDLVNDGTLLVKDGIAKSVKDSDVQVEKAWEKTTGNKDIIVAVLDEGVWVEHPDLKANMWVNENEKAWTSKDDAADNDGNGYSNDYNGYNFVDQTGKINWARTGDTGHGTHVAGVIAAVNNNGVGISSIAGGNNGVGGVKIMSCQVFSGQQGSTAIQIVRAMKYAADNGAVILQCSWGYNSGASNPYNYGQSGYTSQEQWEEANPLQKEAMEYFIHQAGSPSGPIDGGITVWAAGNEYAPMAGFPGAADFAVSVAAIAADFSPASYTNYSTGVTISAPGGDQEYCWEYDESVIGDPNTPVEAAVGALGGILSTMPLEFTKNNGYGYMDGTSMACPHVSGVLALAASHIADQHRIVKASQLQELLHSTATKLENLWPANKMYFVYLQSIGKYVPDKMNLSKYKGGMGSGLVNATALLNALDGVGVPMTFPNVYVGVGEKATVVPARYFAGGEKMTYTVEIEKSDIASCTENGGKLTFEGLKAGSTKATIRTSGGTTQEFLITVRQGAGNLGWM
ncbi:MAG: S8 family serine peptidase [Tidjanibacter sp.]|nr:S8 family serine peptidase [Tidjanibacter sp.]